MHIRTFTAATLQDALADIRRQMGPDATVLHTRDVQRGILGLLGKPRVQVTAGLRTDESRRQAQPDATTDQPASAPPDGNLGLLIRQIRELNGQIEAMKRASSHPEIVAKNNELLNKALIRSGFCRSDADWVCSQIPSEIISVSNPMDSAKQWFRHRMRTSGAIEGPRHGQRIVALVGPTGVGKTTTIAKLAAAFRLREKRSVGLITIDTYRSAAIDQLHKYAEVMELPMEVASTLGEMDSAIQRLQSVEMIFIDTVGRSPNDTRQIDATAAFLQKAKPDEVQLVLSATSSKRVFETAIDRFSTLRPTSLLLTKIDEIEVLPELLWLTQFAALPISYVTTGQKVPDDIEVAVPESLIELAFGNRRGSQPEDVGKAMTAGREKNQVVRTPRKRPQKA